ncbi:hypothetical protein AVEN_194260-1 [Araneus ventricosus]|uniref:Uncharacterized protein n=1 Tax=Araneus ventricosus TaxID=182803 RepID=A0A4Y2GGV1_ARAVE|nr:hypothetical protein AVEN_194260-1 [Araneus ventricosus]
MRVAVCGRALSWSKTTPDKNRTDRMTLIAVCKRSRDTPTNPNTFCHQRTNNTTLLLFSSKEDSVADEMTTDCLPDDTVCPASTYHLAPRNCLGHQYAHVLIKDAWFEFDHNFLTFVNRTKAKGNITANNRLIAAALQQLSSSSSKLHQHNSIMQFEPNMKFERLLSN